MNLNRAPPRNRLDASPAGAATINVNCPAGNLQTALDNANPGDTILVSGTCTGNFLVRNDKVRVFILPQGACLSATINRGGSGTALDIRGKAIAVTSMVITGGIVVQRGANAVLDQNLVQNGDLGGIIVSSSAFAAITNNEIKNSPNGIMVIENSSARIGWNSGFQYNNPGPAAPNDIHNNGFGIFVIGSSATWITSNTIRNNDTGIYVTRASHAVVSNNAINGNGDYGILVDANATLTTGNDGGIFRYPIALLQTTASLESRVSLVASFRAQSGL